MSERVVVTTARWRALRRARAALLMCLALSGHAEPIQPAFYREPDQQTPPHRQLGPQFAAEQHRRPARLEHLQVVAPAWDVTAAGVVTTGDELTAAGTIRGRDLAERVPSLQIEEPTARLTRYSIRGLGSSSFNDGLESSVAMTVDGVYLGRQGMFLADLGDLDHIEVLRGPHGTLAGKNSSAGVINVTTRAPTFAPEAGLDLTFGSDARRQMAGYVSGPMVSDTLAGRLTLQSRRRDGLMQNRLDGRDYNEEHRDSLRGQLLWTPSAITSARLIAETARQDEACCLFAVSHYAPVSRASAAFIGHVLPPPAPWRREVDNDTPSRSSVRQRSMTLQFDQTLAGGEHQLASITGWRDWRVNTTRDLDGIGLAIAPYGGHRLNYRQVSQELRLEGALNDQLDYVTGAYYLEQRQQRLGWLVYGRHAADWYAGAIPALRALGITAADIDDALLAGRRVDTPGGQTARSQALYGQLNWSPTQRIQVRPGLRYTREQKRGSANRLRSGGTAVAPNPFNQAIVAVLDSALGQPYRHRASLREGHLSGQLAASYQFTPQWLGYARWSRGAKSGGINAEPVSRGVSTTFDAERVSMLELGIDGQVQDGRGRLQLALFQIDVADYQALTYASASLGSVPQRDNLMNVGSVQSRGVDLDTALQLSDRIGIRVAATWNDARYRDFDNAPCPPGSVMLLCNRSGERLYGTPVWSVAAGIDGSYVISRHHLLRGAIDYHWRSGFYGTLERGAGSYQAARGLVNARLGLAGMAGGWELTAWARNLFDEKYLAAIYALTGSGDYGAMIGDPRSFGVSLSLRY